VKLVYAAALLLLAIPAFLGLGIFLFHMQNFVFLQREYLIAIVSAAAIILIVIGFFIGISAKKQVQRGMLDRKTASKLKEALDFERSQRIKISESHRLLDRQIAALKSEIKQLRQIKLVSKSEESESEAAESSELVKKYNRIKAELAARKNQVADLQAEIVHLESKSESDVFDEQSLNGDQSLGALLERLVRVSNADEIIIADDQGLMVESAGLSMDSETLAAVSAIVDDQSLKIKELLPFKNIVSFSFCDDHDKLVNFRRVKLFDVWCSLIIITKQDENAYKLSNKIARLIKKYINS
jgi:hypothetical protein